MLTHTYPPHSYRHIHTHMHKLIQSPVETPDNGQRVTTHVSLSHTPTHTLTFV